jgi:hypothetical protein
LFLALKVDTMNVHSDDESSVDLDGGIDLFIQDTQLESITVAALPPVPSDAKLAGAIISCF